MDLVRDLENLVLASGIARGGRANPEGIAGMGCGRWGLCRSRKRDDGQVSASRVVVNVKLELGPWLSTNENLWCGTP